MYLVCVLTITTQLPTHVVRWIETYRVLYLQIGVAFQVLYLGGQLSL